MATLTSENFARRIIALSVTARNGGAPELEGRCPHVALLGKTTDETN